MPAESVHVTDSYALVVYDGATSARAEQVYAMAAYAPDNSAYVRAEQMYALVPYAAVPFAVPRASNLYALVAYSGGGSGDTRSRAWSFVMDGHIFYVLDLGAEGTFLYDTVTQQWCQFQTDGHDGWNFRNGLTWGAADRVVAADTENALAWELNYYGLLDEGFRDITHEVTGGVSTRSRVYIGVDALRISGSIGSIMDDSGSVFKMKFSDDGGKTWSSDFVVNLTQGDFDGEIAWRSLGSFMSPGRVFDFTDVGGMLRIDGADVFLNNFDDDAEQGQ